MKESIWAWWFLVLGLIMIAVVILITDMTTTSEQNYHMIKEISEASMLEAVDYSYYREYGELRINAEKFQENFIRRYAEVVTINKTSKIAFYDIIESPPKITVEVSTSSSQMIIDSMNMTFDITNRLDAILEMYPKSKPGNSGGSASQGGNSSSQGGTSSSGSNTKPTLSFGDFISKYTSSKYYECRDNDCYKPVEVDNFIDPVCSDYLNNYNTNMTRTECESKATKIYSDLPQRVRKGQTFPIKPSWND